MEILVRSLLHLMALFKKIRRMQMGPTSIVFGVQMELILFKLEIEKLKLWTFVLKLRVRIVLSSQILRLQMQ